MKRYFSVFLSILLVLVMCAGCADNPPDSSTPDSSSPEENGLILSLDMKTLSGGKISDEVGGEWLKVQGTTPKLVTGITNSALYFNGIDNYIDLGDGYTLSKDYTIMFWVKPDEEQFDGDSKHILSRGSAGSKKDVLITEMDLTGNLSHQMSVGKGNDTWSDYNKNEETAIALGKWSHVAVVRKGSALAIYVNGVRTYNKENLSDKAFDTTDSTLLIGTGRDSSGAVNMDLAFKGALDDFQIYGVAVSEEEIQAVADSFFSGGGLLIDFDMETLEDGKVVNKATGDVIEVKGAPELVEGKYGNALYFNGVDTYIDMGTKYQFTNDYTLAFWVKQDLVQPGNSAKRIVTCSLPGRDDDAWKVEVNLLKTISHSFSVKLENGAASSVKNLTNNQTKIQRGEWAHVAIVRDGSAVYMYLNGKCTYQNVDLSSTELLSAYYPMVIGGCLDLAKNFKTENAFKGALDDFMLYDEALDSAQIAELTGFPNPMETVGATNGEITLSVKGELDSAPASKDFSLTYSVDGDSPIAVDTTGFVYSETDKTIKLSFAPFKNFRNIDRTLTVQASWDIFTYKADVTIAANTAYKNPIVSDVKIANITKNPELAPDPHVKSVLQATYTYSNEGNVAEGETKYQWYISDTKDGKYTKLKGIYTDTIILIDDYEGKYLKCEVYSTDIYGNESERIMSAPTAKPVAHTDGNPLTDWFYEAKYGVSHHFISDFILSNQTGTQEWNPATESWSDVIDKFDVQEYAKQVAETGAKFVLLTLNQNSAYFCSPNETYDRLLREAGLLGENEVNPLTPTRDLPMEIADELAKYDIKLMLYLPCHPPANASWKNGDQLITKKVFNYNSALDGYPKQKAMEPLHEMIREWSERYGEKLAGWWFDGMFTSATSGSGETYFSGWMNMNNEYNISSFANATKAGNPDRIVAFNHGIEGQNNPYKVSTDYHDFSSGETNTLLELPNNDGRWTEDSPNAQKFLFGFIGEWWGQKGLRLSDQELVSIVTKALEKDVVVMMDINVSTSGKLDTRQVNQLAALKQAVEDKGLR